MHAWAWAFSVSMIAAGCGGSDRDGDDDAGTRTDTGPGTDSGPGEDGGAPTCAADSCEDRVCGRSSCGASCGECAIGFYCTVDGRCADREAMPPPGDSCYDAFNTEVVEGARGFRVCEVDPSLLQSCLCTGGGPSAWTMCGDCVEVILDGARGERCATDNQCAGAVPCHPYIHLCGEMCDAAMPDVCPAGTACGVPGDFTGACLPTCAGCGADCGESSTCLPATSGHVCVPSGYGWVGSC